MNLEDFIENFAAQLDETEPDTIKADTRFKELDEWSSLTALSIIAMVDDEYDVIIKGNDILSSDTIQDLFNIVEKSRITIGGKSCRSQKD
jgi:acyl carrier protein